MFHANAKAFDCSSGSNRDWVTFFSRWCCIGWYKGWPRICLRWQLQWGSLCLLQQWQTRHDEENAGRCWVNQQKLAPAYLGEPRLYLFFYILWQGESQIGVGWNHQARWRKTWWSIVLTDIQFWKGAKPATPVRPDTLHQNITAEMGFNLSYKSKRGRK